MTLARYRAWVLMAVVVAVAALAALLAGRHHAGFTAVRVRFGADIVRPAATGGLLYTNAWVASSARQSVGVYAGSQAATRGNGLFVIVRRSGDASRIRRVVVRGSGAVTLLRPAPPATAQAAATQTLRFVTASGATGTLQLSGDRVSISG